MSFPRYESYHDTAANWAGPVPAHWEAIALKRIASLRSGDAITADEIEEAGPFPVYGGNGLRGFASRFTHEGEFALVGRQGALCGNVNYAIGKFWASEHAVVVRPTRPLVTRWLGEALRAMNLNQYSVSAAQPGLSVEAISSLLIPIPPLPEQQAVADFLDRETAKIDDLVKEQKRLIELLKEKRQAVISQAVTKGLDPNVPMKDSGVGWLSEVPAHWQLSRLANLYSDTDERGSDELPVLTVSIHDGVSDDELDETELDRKVTRSDDKTKYKRVQAGDLVYNMMRAWQGGFGTVTVDGMVSPAYVVARPRTPFPTAFIESILRTPNAVEEMRGRSRGVTDFRLRLYWEEFKEIVVPLPPKAEVEAILAHLREWNSRVADTVSTAEACISILKERRSALISAAVTGKIDVRGLAPQPEGAAA